MPRFAFTHALCSLACLLLLCCGGGGSGGTSATNTPPVVDPEQSFWIIEGSQLGTRLGRLDASDPDGDALTFAVAECLPRTGHFELDTATGDVVAFFTPDHELESLYQLQIEVSDGMATTEATVNIQVTDRTGAVITGRFGHTGLGSADPDTGACEDPPTNPVCGFVYAWRGTTVQAGPTDQDGVFSIEVETPGTWSLDLHCCCPTIWQPYAAWVYEDFPGGLSGSYPFLSPIEVTQDDIDQEREIDIGLFCFDMCWKVDVLSTRSR